MKTTSKSKILTTAIMLFVIAGMTCLSFVNYIQDEKKPWEVPEKFKTMKNPVKSDDSEALASGKILYNKHCKSCHGAKGLGDGPKSKELDTPSGDLSVDLKDQSDGGIFYKVKEGRDDMPSFKKKIPDDEEIWQIVNFVNTLKKN